MSISRENRFELWMPRANIFLDNGGFPQAKHVTSKKTSPPFCNMAPGKSRGESREASSICFLKVTRIGDRSGPRLGVECAEIANYL